ncbi:succinoglycan biosynthesis protein ExoH [Aureimonas pseudogalii]|uniref:Succinoglycan biosynthesis protein ExoH n=1 Tax=Aureimonas pseudogalii TaxID=1744844 RepID=A0A7W6H589_9HYPH|nr:succinoglycan biosynthesis protein ExoH [Aureimonas pseudogalii]
MPGEFADPRSGAFALIRSILCDGLFRVTVPVLTAISGYLLFRSGLDRRWGDLVSRKSRTILLPLVVWNLPLVVALYVVEARHLTGHAFVAPAYPFDLANWIDMTLGLTAQPVNYPLYFLRDLIVLSFLAPLFGMALRRAPWFGLAAVTLVFYPDLDGLLVTRDTMAITFYLGGLAATRRWDLTALDRFWPVCFGLLVLGATLIGTQYLADIRGFTALAPLLVWPLTAAVVDHPAARRLAAASSVSFAVFVSHAPILLAFWLVFERFGTVGSYPLFWLLAPLAAIGVAVGVRTILYRVAPRCAALVYGAR